MTATRARALWRKVASNVKLVEQFRSFLKDTVNLNQDRISRLEANVEALQRFVRSADWGPDIRGFEEQGSWAHGTIIKPVDGGEFDADLLIMVDPVDGWSAADYVQNLGAKFRESGTYKDQTKVWDYCVTVTYAGDRKVDLAPCVVDRLWAGSLEVCNRKSDAFERSEPVQYTAWLKERNTYSGSNSFRKVTRLLKYLRDIKTTFTCPSVLLTTLLGMQIGYWDRDSDAFADVPTTLRTVMQRLDDWLQGRPLKPSIQNPHLSSEDFAEALTQQQYANFRNFIHKYRGWIDEAYEAEDRDESISAWQRIFGDEFAKGEAVKATKSIAEAADSSLRSGLLSSTAPAPTQDLVERVRQFGISILPSIFNRQPHMREPPWTRAISVSADIRIIASWHASRSTAQGTPVQNGAVLQARGGLWFEARLATGQPIPYGYRVHWRITNTGAVAEARRAKRGGFYPSDADSRRWEELQYRGVHISEAFVVRVGDSLLVAQSAPFNVVIE